MKVEITFSNRKTGKSFTTKVVMKKDETNIKAALRAAKKIFGNCSFEFNSRTMRISSSTRFYGDFWVYINGKQIA